MTPTRCALLLLQTLGMASWLAIPMAHSAETPSAKPGHAQSKDVILAPAGMPPAAVSDLLAPPVTEAPAPAAPHVEAKAGPLASALGDLGLHLLREGSERRGNAHSNAVVSPYSAANTLGMLYVGAAGTTAREIGSLFGPRTRLYHTLPDHLQRLNAALAKPSTGIEFISANRVWADKRIGADLGKPYLESIQRRFQGDGALVSFADPAAADLINQWVGSVTHGRIDNFLTPPLPPETRLIATNAVYFKGLWSKPFDPAATRPLPFHPRHGETLQVPTMSGKVLAREGKAGGYQLVELPYGNGDFVLLLAMPQTPSHTLDAMEQDLDGTDLVGFLPQLTRSSITIYLPRFKIAPTPTSLKPALQAAGMKTAFSSAADFSAMLPRQALGADDIIQAAGIMVDEQGSEAVAAGAASMTPKAAPSLNPIRFDRPFIFAVIHKPTSTPLFIGKLAQPQP